MLAGVAAAALVGTIAVADLLMPNEAVINDPTSARALLAKMIEVTGRKPQDFMGRKIISAPAQVRCSEFSNGNVTCVVAVEK